MCSEDRGSGWPTEFRRISCTSWRATKVRLKRRTNILNMWNIFFENVDSFKIRTADVACVQFSSFYRSATYQIRIFDGYNCTGLSSHDNRLSVRTESKIVLPTSKYILFHQHISEIMFRAFEMGGEVRGSDCPTLS